MNIKEKIIDVLGAFNLPLYLQGTMAENEPYPERFLTFFVHSADDESFFDDEATQEVYGVAIMYYDADPERVETFPKNELIPELKEAGFIKTGNGIDVLSDEPTHTGKAFEFLLKDNEVY